MAVKRSANQQFIVSLLISTVVGVGFFTYGAFRNRNFDFSYLLWNLFLAWLPLLFAARLNQTLRTKLWSSWEALSLSVLWFVFLPNSFYMISDFVHIQDVQRASVLYDVVMFTSFIYTGVLLGFASLFLVHQQLLKRMQARAVALWLGGVLLSCSFAVYLGRDLRWNSWDLITNTGGLLFDVADRLQHLGSYPTMLLSVASFFVLLSSMYYMAWRTVALLRQSR